jgi:ribonuclease Y
VNPITIILIVVAIGALLGGGYFFGRRDGRQESQLRFEEQIRQTKEKAEVRLVELQEQQANALSQHNSETAKIRSSLEIEVRERRQELKIQEQRLHHKEESIERKSENLERQERALAQRTQELDHQRLALEALRDQHAAELERIARMTTEEARAELIQAIEESARRQAAIRAREIELRAREEAEAKAREIITLAIQRCASDQVSDITISVVPLPNDEMKGRIIGREGRNIRALESATGVDLIIDDTPEAVILSGFDPVRREVARIALTKLILDGRIHPARIEEMVAKAQQDVEQTVLEEGERACVVAKYNNFHLVLVMFLGGLFFLRFFGHNVLNHSF